MDTHNRRVATLDNRGHILHPKEVDTLRREVDTHQQQVATHQGPVATHQEQGAILLQQEATPHRQVVTKPRLVVTLPQRVATNHKQGATLPRWAAILNQLEVSLPSLEDTNHNLEQEAIHPCHQQAEDGVQHQAAMARQEGLNRDTKGGPPQGSPCQITLEPLLLTPRCLDMEVEFHPTLRRLPYLEGTGALLKTFQGLIH